MAETGNMEELLNAVGLFFDSDGCADLRDKIKGGLFVGRAPETTRSGAELYAVYRLGGGGLEQTLSTDMEKPTIDFMIYAADESSCESLVQARDALTRAWDDKLLTLANDDKGNSRNMVSWTRVTSTAPIPDPDKGWFVVVSYDVVFGVAANTNRRST